MTGHPPYTLLAVGLRGETLRYAHGLTALPWAEFRQLRPEMLYGRVTDAHGRVVLGWERPFVPPPPGPVVSAAGTLSAVHRVAARYVPPAEGEGTGWPTTVCGKPVSPSGLWIAWSPTGLDPLCRRCWPT